jgi:hypothetical protein
MPIDLARIFLSNLSSEVAIIELRAQQSFGELNVDRFNWKPAPDRWSVGQCLLHLVTANEPYFPIFDAVANGTHQRTTWERLPVLPKFFGAAVLNAVHPDTARKSKAPKIFQPAASEVPLDVRDQFLAQQPRLRDAITALLGTDIDLIVTSPVARFITYSLRDALSIVVAHEQRHLNQAERVLEALAQSKSR